MSNYILEHINGHLRQYNLCMKLKNYQSDCQNCQHCQFHVLSPTVTLKLCYSYLIRALWKLTIYFRTGGSFLHLVLIWAHQTHLSEQNTKFSAQCQKSTLLKIADLAIKLPNLQLFYCQTPRYPWKLLLYVRRGCLLYTWYLFEFILTIIKPARGDLLHPVKSLSELILHCWESTTSSIKI